MIFGLLVLSTAAVAPITTSAGLPCDGVRIIERATGDRPFPFASLREQGRTLAYVRNAAGQRVQQEVTVTNVQALAGFSRCRFVYLQSRTDLACYIAGTLPDTETSAISAKLTTTSEAIGACLTNRALTRGESEIGSTPSVFFSAGPSYPFWQISMVPTQDDPARVQPELLVLGAASIVTTTRAVARTKTKASARRKQN